MFQENHRKRGVVLTCGLLYLQNDMKELLFSMKKVILLLFLLPVYGIAQLSPADDSLRKVLYRLPDDTAKVNRLNALAEKIQFAEPVEAISILQTAVNTSNNINYPLGASTAYGMRAMLLFYEMKLDSAKQVVDQAYNLVHKEKGIKYRNQLAALTNIYGSIHQQRQQYDSAVEKYQQAAVIYSETKNDTKIIVSFYNLSVMYGFLEEPAKSLYYARQVQQIARKANDSIFILRSFIALSDAYLNLKNYDSVLLFSQTGLSMAMQQNVTFAIGKFHALLGTYFSEGLNEPDSAITHFNLALKYFTLINLQYDIAIVLQKMGNAYLKKNDYANAIQYSGQAAELTRKLNLQQVLLNSLKTLVTAEEKRGNSAESFRYLKEYTAVNDSLQNRNNSKKVAELEAKYQIENKEALLRVQQAVIDKKNLVNYVLAGSAVVLVLISLLSYRTYRQKQKLQQQQIAELEKEKQLLAAEAVLEGQEQERVRLAKDLHDGLGGMLSGIKYSFTTMKENLVLTPDNTMAFERGIDMLGSSIKELRMVAHNLMPESLVKFGLDTALKDFCSSITASGVLKVNYHSFGLEQMQPGQSTAIIIYRVIQELINNVIKHAAAKEAIVQLQYQNNQLQVTVEDDGKGFDVNSLEIAKGIGWNNIKNRVEYLKGKVNVVSEKNKGTSVTIEMNI